MQREQNKLITVIGNIGSGKSTIVAQLASTLPATLINADPFEENPFLHAYSSDHARWALATELFFTFDRIERLKSSLKQLHGTGVIDSGLLMGVYVYAKQHLKMKTMSPDEWDLFNTITQASLSDTLLYPDVVVSVKCPVDVCKKRILERGRAFEAGHTMEYLHVLDACLDELEADLRDRGITVISVDSVACDYRDAENMTKLVAMVQEVSP